MKLMADLSQGTAASGAQNDRIVLSLICNCFDIFS
jgi:hypothetical protein